MKLNGNKNEKEKDKIRTSPANAHLAPHARRKPVQGKPKTRLKIKKNTRAHEGSLVQVHAWFITFVSAIDKGRFM
jgi:hypothetical protein